MKYPAYPRYKPSGVEWLGDVPEHWDIKKLRHIVYRRDHKVEADESRPLPYIGMEHVESWTGKLLPLDENLVPNGISNHFQKGDLLFGKLRPYLAKACMAGFEGLCSSEFLVLQPRYNHKFLLYQLLSSGFISTVDSSTYGAKMPRASWEFIGSCWLTCPSFEEQCAIADFLDAQTAKIDTLLAKKRELIEKLKEKRAALISRTVTRGLPPEAARAAGLDPHPKFKPSNDYWSGEIPEHWEIMAIRRSARSIQTGRTPPTAEERYYEDGTIPWFGPASFNDQMILTEPTKYLHPSAITENAAQLFEAGATMIVTIGATLGKVSSLVEASSCNQQITVIEFNHNKVYPRFGTYQLKRLEYTLRAIAPSATLPILTQNDIGNIRLPLPPVGEQRLIVDFLDRETEKIDRLITKMEDAVLHLKEYRSTLITAAVTGKIDVRGVTA